jgi:hypothetical protein
MTACIYFETTSDSFFVHLGTCNIVTKVYSLTFLGTFVNLQKVTISFVIFVCLFVCLSVCPHGTPQLSLEEFS